MLLSDDGEVTRYTYDYAGNCAIKSHGPMTSVYINGALQGVDYHDDSDYTLYVSPFMTVNADRFTKYYYAGTQRIAGKIGNGKFENIYGEDGFHLTAGQKDYAQRAVNMLEGLQAYYPQTGVTPGVPNQLGKTADPYVSGTAYPSVALGNYDVPDGWPGKVVKHGKGEVPGPPVWFEEESVQEAVAGAGYQSDNQQEKDIFFYHTDHLQSTTYLTDSIGNVSQFLWYAPYGEALIDEHVGSYENPYKFSGKELDENTGLYDHGARHRDPSSGVWYGVDALFEKYPSCSPYAYCMGNPIRIIDPNGKVCCDADGNVIISYDQQKVGSLLQQRLNDPKISDAAKRAYNAIEQDENGNYVCLSRGGYVYNCGVATTDKGTPFLVYTTGNGTIDDKSNCAGVSMLGGQAGTVTGYEGDIILEDEYDERLARLPGDIVVWRTKGIGSEHFAKCLQSGLRNGDEFTSLFLTKAGYGNEARIILSTDPSAVISWDNAVEKSALDQTNNESIKFYYSSKRNRIVPKTINPMMP